MSYPTIYTDSNGARVVNRHRGPAGPGVPAGGTDGQILSKVGIDDYDTEWITNPALATGVTSAATGDDLDIAVYDGAATRAIKKSGTKIADLATAAALSGKMDIVPVSVGVGYRVASDVNYTQAEASKLALLKEYYRGRHADITALTLAVPAPAIGEYATLFNAPAAFAYCGTAGVWTVLEVDMTAIEIATLIFNSTDVAANQPGAVWDFDNCRIFTASDKSALDSHSQILQSLSASIAPVEYQEVGANYTLTNSDRTVCVASGTVTLTLPTSVGNKGRIFTIKNLSASDATVTPFTGETIDADASVTLAQYECLTVQSRGTSAGYIKLSLM